MGAVRLLVRSELRRRWRSLVVVALLVGVRRCVPRSPRWPGPGGRRPPSTGSRRALEAMTCCCSPRASTGPTSSSSVRSRAWTPSGTCVSSRSSDRTASSSRSAGHSTARCSVTSTGCASSTAGPPDRRYRRRSSSRNRSLAPPASGSVTRFRSAASPRSRSATSPRARSETSGTRGSDGAAARRGDQSPADRPQLAGPEGGVLILQRSFVEKYGPRRRELLGRERRGAVRAAHRR